MTPTSKEAMEIATPLAMQIMQSDRGKTLGERVGALAENAQSIARAIDDAFRRGQVAERESTARLLPTEQLDEEAEDDVTCSRCHAICQVSDEYELPKHGMCWPCATAALDDLIRAIRARGTP